MTKVAPNERFLFLRDFLSPPFSVGILVGTTSPLNFFSFLKSLPQQFSGHQHPALPA